MNYSGTARFLLAIVLLHFVATAVVPEAEGIEGESERIVGGSRAEEGQFPWMGALHINNNFICTGSIVSPTTFLTAAHCVVDRQGQIQPFSSFYAIANVNRNSPSYRMDFSSLTVHPEYDNTRINNDVAFFRTSQPIPFSDTIQSICIADPNTTMNQYRNATAMGWGNSSPVSLIPVYFEFLQYAEQDIVRNSLCAMTNGGVDDNKICARRLGSAICSGDSGGPLVHLSANKSPVQIGIASYGNAFADCFTISPAVFARVSRYSRFIQEASGDGMIRTC